MFSGRGLGHRRNRRRRPKQWLCSDYIDSDMEPEQVQAILKNRRKQAKVKVKRVSTSTNESSRVRSGLNQLILTKTNGLMKQWPWTNCVMKLEKKGYQLKLKPGSTTSWDLITSPSSHIPEVEAIKINNDLTLKLIEIVMI